MDKDDVTKFNKADIFLQVYAQLSEFKRALARKYSGHVAHVYSTICEMNFLQYSQLQGGICTTVWNTTTLADFCGLHATNVHRALAILKKEGHLTHRKLFFHDTYIDRKHFEEYRKICLENAFGEDTDITEYLTATKLKKPTTEDMEVFNLPSNKYFVVDYYVVDYKYYKKHWEGLVEFWKSADGWIVESGNWYNFRSNIFKLGKRGQYLNKKELKKTELEELLNEDAYFSNEFLREIKDPNGTTDDIIIEE